MSGAKIKSKQFYHEKSTATDGTGTCAARLDSAPEMALACRILAARATSPRSPGRAIWMHVSRAAPRPHASHRTLEEHRGP